MNASCAELHCSALHSPGGLRIIRKDVMIDSETEAGISVIEMTPAPRRMPDVVELLHVIEKSPPSRSITEIEKSLIAYGEALKSRDSLLKEAKTAGISEARIAKLTGHSRNTVRSALAAGVVAGSQS